MPRYLDKDETEILRCGRRDYTCAGNGAGKEYRKHAPLCDAREHIIPAGTLHVEYVGEVPLWQTGSRHCLDCYRLFWERPGI